jgi:hypothetical protein
MLYGVDTSRGTALSSCIAAVGGGENDPSRFKSKMSSSVPVIPFDGIPRVPPVPSLYGSISPQLCDPGTILVRTHHTVSQPPPEWGSHSACCLESQGSPHATVLDEGIVEWQPRRQHVVGKYNGPRGRVLVPTCHSAVVRRLRRTDIADALGG